MRLTAEQFADLAASFQPHFSDGDTDRRRAVRLELEARVILRALDDAGELEKPFGAHVYDFSSRGIAILHKTPMQNGVQFVAELQRQSGGCVSMLCTVRHCKQFQPHRYKIGAEFTCVLAEHPGAKPSDGAAEAELRRIRQSVLG